MDKEIDTGFGVKLKKVKKKSMFSNEFMKDYELKNTLKKKKKCKKL